MYCVLSGVNVRVHPGENVIFICTVPSVTHWWNISSFDIRRSLTSRDRGTVIQDPPFNFTVTEVRLGIYIISIATVTITMELNGIIVLCRDGYQVLSDPIIWVVVFAGEQWKSLDSGFIPVCVYSGHLGNTLMWEYCACKAL